MIQSRLLRLIVLAGMTHFLAACSPQFNWRQVQDASHTFTVFLPAKPAVFTRDIGLDDTQVAMTITAAQVDGTTFAVGELPRPGHLTDTEIIARMAQALTHNIQGREDRTALPVLPAAPPARDLYLHGTNQGKPVRMIARLIVHNDRVFQLMILATTQAIDEEQVTHFFGGFRYLAGSSD